MQTPSSNLTVIHNAEESVVNFEGEIGEIRVDGEKLSDIHDLAIKIDKMTTIIKALAFVATFLAVVAVAIVGGIGSWLATNKEQITQTMDTTEQRFSKRINLLQNQNTTYAQKLTELGWVWKDGGWQQNGNTAPKYSK